MEETSYYFPRIVSVASLFWSSTENTEMVYYTRVTQECACKVTMANNVQRRQYL